MKTILSALALVAALALASSASAMDCHYVEEEVEYGCSIWVSVYLHPSPYCHMEVTTYGPSDYGDCLGMLGLWCDAGAAQICNLNAASATYYDYGYGSLEGGMLCDCYNYAGGSSEARLWYSNKPMYSCSCNGNGSCYNFAWRYQAYCE